MNQTKDTELQEFTDILDRRADFPSLKREVNNYPVAYFDGPGGTQLPSQVLDSMVYYYHNCNANAQGFFQTGIESDRIIQEAREASARLFNAEGPETISFGANMTTLTYSLSKAIGRTLNPGDEILITQLDHEANRGPWIGLEENGIKVKEIKLLPQGILDYESIENQISKKTKVVAVGYASNALGTINDLARVRQITKQYGALMVVDAVHYLPHFSIDVQALELDFLLCSAYKFYGPHVGILYSRQGLLETLPTDRLRTQKQKAPYIIETGTLNHAAIAGVKGAVDYIASFGQGASQREQLVSGMERIAHYEHLLARRLYNGLKEIPGITIYGPSIKTTPRAPTFSFTVEGKDPPEVCRQLDRWGISAWDGHFYAIRPVEVLGLYEKGGLVRVGISLYNTEEEVDRLLEALREISTN